VWTFLFLHHLILTPNPILPTFSRGLDSLGERGTVEVSIEREGADWSSRCQTELFTIIPISPTNEYLHAVIFFAPQANEKGEHPMGKVLSFVYGIIAHVGFLIVLFYLIGFLANIVVPKNINSGEIAPFMQALAINIILLALFAIQHSVMARPDFKRWWTTLIPPYLERSTYVLMSNGVVVLMLWQWQPMPEVIWQVENPVGVMVLWGLFGLGWMVLVLASFMINHFDLFGTRQVYLHFRGERYSPLPFKTRGFYKYIRHPLMLGWLLAFWATPYMTEGHLVFAVGTTVYILAAIQIEERDLVNSHGETYEKYRRQTSMLLPLKKTRP